MLRTKKTKQRKLFKGARIYKKTPDWRWPDLDKGLEEAIRADDAREMVRRTTDSAQRGLRIDSGVRQMPQHGTG